MTKARRASSRGGRRNRAQAIELGRGSMPRLRCAVLSFTTGSTEDTEEDSSRSLCSPCPLWFKVLHASALTFDIVVISCRYRPAAPAGLCPGEAYECLAGTFRRRVADRRYRYRHVPGR